MTKKMSHGKIWGGAFILTIAGLITKFLSAAYRIPFQNIAGDVGFYIYQQVYPLYGIALVLALYGFPVVISKLVVEHRPFDRAQATKLIYVTAAILSLLGLGLFLILYIGATRIAAWMGDPMLALPIRTVSFTFLLMPFLAVFRGFFQGNEQMKPTAVSQVAEQAIRVGTILFLSYLFMQKGYNVYIVGSGALFGSVIGGMAAVLVLLYYRVKSGAMVPARKWLPVQIDIGKVIKVLLVHGLAVCINSLMLILFQLIDSVTLYKQLVASGIDLQEAKQLKGIFDRGQPLIQLGTVFATSLSLALVPFISRAKAMGHEADLLDKMTLAIRVSLAVGFGATVGLMLIAGPTNRMLFMDDAGTDVLRVLSIAILFSSVALTLSAILQGLGKIYLPAIIVAIGVAVKWLGNLILIQTYGTSGAAVSTVIGFLVISGVHMLIITGIFKHHLISMSSLMPLLVAGAIMAVLLVGYRFISLGMGIPVHQSRSAAGLFAISSALLGGVLYMMILIRMNLFSKQELSILPVLNRFSKWAK